MFYKNHDRTSKKATHPATNTVNERMTASVSPSNQARRDHKVTETYKFSVVSQLFPRRRDCDDDSHDLCVDTPSVGSTLFVGLRKAWTLWVGTTCWDIPRWATRVAWCQTQASQLGPPPLWRRRSQTAPLLQRHAAPGYQRGVAAGSIPHTRRETAQAFCFSEVSWPLEEPQSGRSSNFVIWAW